MEKLRNVGIIGASSSDNDELFEAIKRLDQLPKLKLPGYWSGDGLTDWTELLPKSYDASKRKRIFK